MKRPARYNLILAVTLGIVLGLTGGAVYYLASAQTPFVRLLPNVLSVGSDPQNLKVKVDGSVGTVTARKFYVQGTDPDTDTLTVETGRVGIGTDPASALHIAGDAIIEGDIIIGTGASIRTLRVVAGTCPEGSETLIIKLIRTYTHASCDDGICGVVTLPWGTEGFSITCDYGYCVRHTAEYSFCIGAP